MVQWARMVDEVMGEPAHHDVFVICGPSGVGKSTLIRRLFATVPNLRFSVSRTTRPPRAGERDGVDYYFVSDHEFDRAVADDEFLEWAPYAQCRYGTPRSEIERARAAGQDLVLDIDIQGARQVRERLPGAVFVFIAPPQPEVLYERLAKRGANTPEEIARRLDTARREMAERDWFTHEVINDDLATAVAALQRIICEERSQHQ